MCESMISVCVKKNKIIIITIGFEFLVIIVILFICCLFVRTSKYGCETVKFDRSKINCCYFYFISKNTIFLKL